MGRVIRRAGHPVIASRAVGGHGPGACGGLVATHPYLTSSIFHLCIPAQGQVVFTVLSERMADQSADMSARKIAHCDISHGIM